MTIAFELAEELSRIADGLEKNVHCEDLSSKLMLLGYVRELRMMAAEGTRNHDIGGYDLPWLD